MSKKKKQVLGIVGLVSLLVVGYLFLTGKGHLLDPQYPKYDTQICYHAADFSGDGSKVYFLKEVRGWKQVRPMGWSDGWYIEKSHLWLCSINSDGTDRREIKEVFPPATWILNHTDTFVDMAVCPKDDRIAWTSIGCTDEIDGLWVMDADGNNLKKLFDEPEDGLVKYPAWSYDGVYVLINVAPYDIARIWKVKADGSEKVCLSDAPGDEHPAFSPDGKRIAFTKNLLELGSSLNTELWVMDSDGKNRERVVPRAAAKAFFNRRWTADGKGIIFWNSWDGNLVLDLGSGIVTDIDLRGDKISMNEDYTLTIYSRGLFIRPAGSVTADGPRVPLDAKRLRGQRLRDLLGRVDSLW